MTDKRERESLDRLTNKARALFEENHSITTKRALWENLVEQAYHSGRADEAESALERLLASR